MPKAKLLTMPSLGKTSVKLRDLIGGSRCGRLGCEKAESGGDSHATQRQS